MNKFELLAEQKERVKFPITGGFVLVDKEDIPKLGKRKWHISGGYAKRNTTINWVWIRESMHRLIIGAKKGEIVDHINGNRLDNRKNNLRIVSKSLNNLSRNYNTNNSSGYRGVHWCNTKKKWIARITFNSKTKNLGHFDDKKRAYEIWLKNAKQLGFML